MLSGYAWQLLGGGLFLLVYWLLLLWVRSVYVARANRVWTDAHADTLAARLSLLSAGSPCPEALLVEAIQRLLEPFGQREPAPKFRWQFTWNGAEEIGDWVRLHEAKRLALQCLPKESVLPRFERAMGQIDELPPGRQRAWKDKREELWRPEGRSGPRREPDSEALRGHLIELLTEVHNARDAKYAQLAALHGKAFWLIGAAMLPVAVLVAMGYGVVLVAGAIGGLVSRLQRIVFAEGLPTAYGSSWVPLFCAPLLGALAAWAGLHLIVLLQALGVVDLQALIDRAEDLRLLVPPAGIIGVAVLLGLSERFLNRIGSEADRVLETPADQPAPASRPPKRARAAAARKDTPVRV